MGVHLGQKEAVLVMKPAQARRDEVEGALHFLGHLKEGGGARDGHPSPVHAAGGAIDQVRAPLELRDGHRRGSVRDGGGRRRETAQERQDQEDQVRRFGVLHRIADAEGRDQERGGRQSRRRRA